jgi:hypothetical protein
VRPRRRLLAAGLGAALGLVLAGCATVPSIDHRQLALLEKGQSPDQVVAVLKQPPLAQRVLPPGLSGRRFSFMEYRVRTGDFVDVYFIAFERDRLVYWGYAMEFRRQPDRELADALGAAIGGAPAPAPALPPAPRG